MATHCCFVALHSYSCGMVWATVFNADVRDELIEYKSSTNFALNNAFWTCTHMRCFIRHLIERFGYVDVVYVRIDSSSFCERSFFFYAFSFEVAVLTYCFRFQCCHLILSSAASKANLIKLMSHFHASQHCMTTATMAHIVIQWFRMFGLATRRKLHMESYFLSKIETINYFCSMFFLGWQCVIVSLACLLYPLSLSFARLLSLPRSLHPLSLSLSSYFLVFTPPPSYNSLESSPLFLLLYPLRLRFSIGP